MQHNEFIKFNNRYSKSMDFISQINDENIRRSGESEAIALVNGAL